MTYLEEFNRGRQTYEKGQRDAEQGWTIMALAVQEGRKTKSISTLVKETRYGTDKIKALLAYAECPQEHRDFATMGGTHYGHAYADLLAKHGGDHEKAVSVLKSLIEDKEVTNVRAEISPERDHGAAKRALAHKERKKLFKKLTPEQRAEVEADLHAVREQEGEITEAEKHAALAEAAAVQLAAYQAARAKHKTQMPKVVQASDVADVDADFERMIRLAGGILDRLTDMDMDDSARELFTSDLTRLEHVMGWIKSHIESGDTSFESALAEILEGGE